MPLPSPPLSCSPMEPSSPITHLLTFSRVVSDGGTVLPSSATVVSGRPPTLKGLWFQVRELQTRLQSVQATGPSSPGRLTSANRPINPSTGELSTSSSSNDIPIAKVSSQDESGEGRNTSYLKTAAVAEPTIVQPCQCTSPCGIPWD